MRATLVLVAALAAACALGVRADDVVTVTGGYSELETLAKKHPFLVVEFYAPWCGHCKRLEPEWAKAATALKGFEPTITLAKLDATDKANEDAKTKFKIGGFPTIKLFVNGKLDTPLAYEGPRDEAGIVKYLKKQVMPAFVQLEKADAVADAKKAADVLVLAYLESKDGAEAKTFAEVAQQLRNDMDFAFVTDRSLIEECKSASDCKSPFVVMHKAGEEEVPRYEGDFKAGLLQAWAGAKSLPSVIKFGNAAHQKHVQKAFGAQTPRLVAVAKAEDSALLEQLRQASKANDELSVIFADEATGKRLIDYYGLKVEGDAATLLIEDPKAAAKFLKQGAKASDVPEFLRQFQEGALERWLKSEEPPKDNDGPVRVLTAKTFDADVFKAGKDVFIEFYAPWCGHCKKLAPIWDEIGEQYKGDDGIVIAKLDATQNDIPTPKISVRGYPTLFFVTAKGDVVPYSGNRSKEDLLKFIADKRTTQAPAKKEEKKEEAKKEEEDNDDKTEL